MSAASVCPVSGCPELTPCKTHPKTTSRRGYGTKHVRLRKQWARKVAAGDVDCWRCGARISPLEAWDLGHDDYDRSVYRGPEHRACNRATAGR